MNRVILTFMACLVAGGVCLADKPPQTQPADVRKTMRSIWRDDIAAPEDTATNDLSQAIRQLKAIVAPRSKAPAVSPASQVPVAASPEASVAKSAVEATTRPATQPTTKPAVEPPADAGESAAALTLLSSMAVEKLANACGVADGLYRAGQYEAALAIYVRLQEYPPKDVSGDWLLFQLANCHCRCGNYEQATLLFQKMISGFPESPWLPVAKVQGQLAAWRQQARPTELLTSVGAKK